MLYNNIFEKAKVLAKRINSAECFDYDGSSDGSFNESTVTSIIAETFSDIQTTKPLNEVSEKYKRVFVWFDNHWKLGVITERQDKLFNWNVGKPYKVIYFIGCRYAFPIIKYEKYPAIGIDIPEPVVKEIK